MHVRSRGTKGLVLKLRLRDVNLYLTGEGPSSVTKKKDPISGCYRCGFNPGASAVHGCRTRSEKIDVGERMSD